MARDLADIAGRLGTPGTRFPGGDAGDLVAFARRLLAERRLRERHFDRRLFADPVWDLLLDLFVAGEECRRISISSAAIAANVSPTTALRYIATMVVEGMVVRWVDDGDGRRVFVALSEDARLHMVQYLGVAMAMRASQPPRRPADLPDPGQ